MKEEFLPTLFQQFIHKSRYARWMWDKKSREFWPETVSRYFDFFEEHLKEKYDYVLSKKLRNRLENAVLELMVMPSMRALMTAGKALERDNVAGYNCSYLPMNRIRSFDELLYILMCGAGVGFSVERQIINELPTVSEEMYDTDTTIVVSDSKIGWGKAFRELVSLLYSGQIPKWDLSKLRPKGAPLKTFGGRSSGPEPLNDLFVFTTNIFRNACGRKLNSLEIHDICCKIGEVVVVGGVRRSALISLSNLTDERMRGAKMGDWWKFNKQRALANNSVCYTETPDIGIFMKEWTALYESKAGERGVFNRVAAQKHTEKLGDRRDHTKIHGTNPCSEILMRMFQFCNLTEVVLRPEDTFEDVWEKVEIATIMGTFQSTLTDFRYLSAEWKKTCEEERLLGVSLTGIMDHPLFNGQKEFDKLPERLENLKEHAVQVNKKYAKELGINPSAAITCVKPSGTASSLVNSSSGIHARHSLYYIRSARADVNDPLTKFLIQEGVPYEPCVDKPQHQMVFFFPIKSPDKAIFAEDRTAIEQLEFWKIYQDHWCEHKPSVTIYVKEKEWMEVGAWVYKHFDDISGVSFLPYDGGMYRQAPFQKCTKEEYDEMMKKMPKEIDWEKLNEFEDEDNTVASQEFACSGGVCDILDTMIDE